MKGDFLLECINSGLKPTVNQSHFNREKESSAVGTHAIHSS